MIARAIMKKLPSLSPIMAEIRTLEDFNALNHAYYALFNSYLLTRSDYRHIFAVLCDKLPIYEKTADTQQYKDIATRYATFNYIQNPDVPRVIGEFIDRIKPISLILLQLSLLSIRDQLSESSEFVGIEVINKHIFSNTDQSEKTFRNIRKIVLG